MLKETSKCPTNIIKVYCVLQANDAVAIYLTAHSCLKCKNKSLYKNSN